MPIENEIQRDSKLLFLEKATWKRGQEIITVLLPDEHGRKHNVAHIYLEYSGEPKKNVFIVSDAKGMGMLAPSVHLSEVKNKLIALEPHLARLLKQRQLAEARDRNSGREKGMSR